MPQVDLLQRVQVVSTVALRLLAARRRASRDSGQLADTFIQFELDRYMPRQAKRILPAKLIELTGLEWLAGLAGPAAMADWAVAGEYA